MSMTDAERRPFFFVHFKGEPPASKHRLRLLIPAEMDESLPVARLHIPDINQLESPLYILALLNFKLFNGFNQRGQFQEAIVPGIEIRLFFLPVLSSKTFIRIPSVKNDNSLILFEITSKSK